MFKLKKSCLIKNCIEHFKAAILPVEFISFNFKTNELTMTITSKSNCWCSKISLDKSAFEEYSSADNRAACTRLSSLLKIIDMFRQNCSLVAILEEDTIKFTLDGPGSKTQQIILNLSSESNYQEMGELLQQSFENYVQVPKFECKRIVELFETEEATKFTVDADQRTLILSSVDESITLQLKNLRSKDTSYGGQLFSLKLLFPILSRMVLTEEITLQFGNSNILGKFVLIPIWLWYK